MLQRICFRTPWCSAEGGRGAPDHERATPKPLKSWLMAEGRGYPLDAQSIIAELESERDRLNNAIAALQSSQARLGRTGTRNGWRRHLSAAARRKIGLAMKKRWAERKKKAAA